MDRSIGTLFSWALTSALFVCLPACGGSDSSGGSSSQPTTGFGPTAIADLHAAGVDKYIGKATPVSQSTDGDVTIYEFDKANGAGPICLWGDTFRASIRDTGSENLLIYLQGGGACRTSLCAANTGAAGTIPVTGILNNTRTTNVVASWNVVYVPYCDGATFSGDNELQDTTNAPAGSGTTRYHRGLRNLTAALDLAKAHYPNPKRILLAGSSAGGYGTIVGTAVVRFEYPSTPLIVFSDAGVVLASDDPLVLPEMLSEWKFDQFFPKSCTECTANDVAQVVAWGLRNDPSLRAVGFDSYNDAVLNYFFHNSSPDTFKNALVQQSGSVHEEFPDRFKRFLVNGGEHTTLIGDKGDGTSLGGYQDVFDGISIEDWTKAFVDDTPDWTDHLQQ